MADEKVQATPTNGADNGLFTYYYGDPDGVTKDERCHVFMTPIKFETLPWHIYDVAPDASLEDPVWDRNQNKWVENSNKAQTQILAQAQTEIENLRASKESLDTQIKQVQEVQTASAQQSQMVTKQLGQMMQMMQTMQTTMQGLGQMIQTTPQAPKANAQDTKATETTNGGKE